ncbi:hypothetical protein PROFUN_17041, partial [Planoprotostelium fungivorum]
TLRGCGTIEFCIFCNKFNKRFVPLRFVIFLLSHNYTCTILNIAKSIDAWVSSREVSWNLRGQRHHK